MGMTWRDRRKLSYLMHEFDDIRLDVTVKEMSAPRIMKTVVRFFEEGSELLYPAKSYFVAIVYAKLLEKHFGVPFMDALNMDDLLPDDKWFLPYRKAKVIYDGVLTGIPEDFLKLPSTKKTTAYFMQEFLLENDGG